MSVITQNKEIITSSSRSDKTRDKIADSILWNVLAMVLVVSSLFLWFYQSLLNAEDG